MVFGIDIPRHGSRKERANLDKSIFTFSTVTYAIKARKLLLRAGINARVVRTDGSAEGARCVHGLEVDRTDYFRVLLILKENGISYSVYQ